VQVRAFFDGASRNYFLFTEKYSMGWSAESRGAFYRLTYGSKIKPAEPASSSTSRLVLIDTDSSSEREKSSRKTTDKKKPPCGGFFGLQ
jgi:hypothetical protein